MNWLIDHCAEAVGGLSLCIFAPSLLFLLLGADEWLPPLLGRMKSGACAQPLYSMPFSQRRHWHRTRTLLMRFR